VTRDKELGKSEKREGRESGVFHDPGGHFTFGILLKIYERSRESQPPFFPAD